MVQAPSCQLIQIPAPEFGHRKMTLKCNLKQQEKVLEYR